MRTCLILVGLALGTPLSGARAAAPEARFGGFGEYRVDASVPCLTDEQRAEIQARISAGIRTLRAENLLPPPAAQAVSFDWPVRLKAGLGDPGFHGISNFVDHDPGYPNAVQDYMCGTRTYDLSNGYNHQGTDVFSWPFGWYKMDHDQVEVVAAAPGTIVSKSDGNYDRDCSFTGSDWNAVYVVHADGSEAWYGHLKSGSLTPKAAGQTVSRGEYLGIVGSSGNSTGPHLHFEVYDAANHLIDPYAGPCNSSTPTTWWTSERPYYDSAINAIMTHDAPPVFPACPGEETLNQRTAFMPGETAYFAVYYRDQLSGQVSNYAVYDAANALVTRWSHSSPSPFYAASYWYWSLTLPTNRSNGWWRFQVTYLGTTYQRPFYVGDPTAVAGLPAAAGIRFIGGTPNPVASGASFEFELLARERVRLVLLDGEGRRVTTLSNGWFGSGAHHVSWDGRDAGGRAVAPGLYFARLEADRRAAITRKVVVAR